jgi:Family of unknown function (DUF5302)
MTKSAKQGTAKAPAESAGTESAADSAQAGQDDQAGQEAATPAAEAEEAGLDETKRKFREALERKHQAHNEGQGKGGKDAGKISGAHGPAASRRNFRRKSG